MDSSSGACWVPEQDIQEDFESFVVNDQDEVTIYTQKNPGTVGTFDNVQLQDPCPSKSAVGNQTLKAQFGHQRTHNEQTLVNPCGVIFTHTTMFGTQAASNFLNTLSVPGVQKSEHIIYNINCDVRQQAEKDPWLKGVGMCVDTWHLCNNDAITHQYCQLHCNPAQYPELMMPLESGSLIHQLHNRWMHVLGDIILYVRRCYQPSLIYFLMKWFIFKLLKL